MRKLLVNALLFGVLGFILGAVGITILTWEFWVVLFILLGIQIINTIIYVLFK